MKSLTIFVVLLGMLFSLVTSELFSQYIPRAERGDTTAHRKTTIDTNNIRTTIFNTGLTGRAGYPNPDEIPYEWPKHSGNKYITLTGIFVGGEVVGNDGDTLHIVNVVQYRQSPNGNTWNFEPVPEYQNTNSDQIANSNDPSTWPIIWPDKSDDSIDPGWPGSWNGFFGKNIFINGCELYYHLSDDLYDRYLNSFQPDSTDLTRSGLGIVLSQRVLQWTEGDLADAIVYITDIYNAGTTDISKAGVTVWVADLVGGDFDSSDDYFYYDLSRNTIYFEDNDGLGNMGQPIGVAALVFLQTPDSTLLGLSQQNARSTGFMQTPNQLGITNIRYWPAGGLNISSDRGLWIDFMTPGNFMPMPSPVGDYDLFASSSYFPLPAGQFQRLVTALVFGDDTASVNNKIDSVVDLYDSLFTFINRTAETKVETFKLHQNYPNPFNPITHIRYGLPKATDVKIELYNILGQRVKTLLNTRKPAGYHVVVFDGSKLASGVYIYRIEAGEFQEVKKMILLK